MCVNMQYTTVKSKYPGNDAIVVNGWSNGNENKILSAGDLHTEDGMLDVQTNLSQ